MANDPYAQFKDADKVQWPETYLAAPNGAPSSVDDEFAGFPDAPQNTAEAVKLPPASFGKRFVNGGLDAMYGTAQLLNKVGEPVGLADPRVVQTMDRMAADHMRQADIDSGDEFDGGRLLGNAVATAPTMLLGGPEVTLGRVALGGARMGAAAGAMQPVDIEKGGYAGQKAGQIAVGAAAGGVLSPVAVGGTRGILSAVNALRTRISAGMTPAQIQVTIQNTLQQHGVDFAALDAQTQAYLQQQVAGALNRGGQLQGRELANAATLRAAGIENPTTGQISQDPIQFGTELYLRHQEGGRPLAAQYAGALESLNARLRRIQGNAAPALDAPTAGARVMRPLEEANQRGQTLERTLYRTAENAPDNPLFVGSRQALDSSLEALRLQRLDRSVPAGAQSILDEMASGRYSVRSASRDLQNLNAMIRQHAGTPEGVAAGIIRNQLDDALERSLTTADDFYRTARRASAQRFALGEQVPALQAVREGTIAPDDFLRVHVTGPSAKVQDVAGLRDFLNQTDPGAWRQVQGQVLAQLQEAATKGTENKFQQAAYNTALRTLDKQGKLRILFNDEQIQTLRNIGRAGELLEGPPGVMRNGLLGGARAAESLARIITGLGTLVPGVGRFASVPLAEAVRNVPLRQAANAALDGGGLAVEDVLQLPTLKYLRSLPGGVAAAAGTESQ